MVASHGVVFVHSVPAAVVPHVEWAIAGVVGDRVSLSWTPQPALPGTLRAECRWTGAPGTASKIASALRAWAMVHFEVTEEATPMTDGERICHVPGRPLWRSVVSANGDLMLTEDRIRHLMADAQTLEGLKHALDAALGAEVDADLEPFRSGGDGAPVTWLHQVG